MVLSYHFLSHYFTLTLAYCKRGVEIISALWKRLGSRGTSLKHIKPLSLQCSSGWPDFPWGWRVVMGHSCQSSCRELSGVLAARDWVIKGIAQGLAWPFPHWGSRMPQGRVSLIIIMMIIITASISVCMVCVRTNGLHLHSLSELFRLCVCIRPTDKDTGAQRRYIIWSRACYQ